jgi:hypothetical protein
MKTCESCKHSAGALCTVLNPFDYDDSLNDWFADDDTVISFDSTIAFNPNKQCPSYEEKNP